MTDRKTTFETIFRKRGFGGEESVSGPGSSLDATATVRRDLQELLHKLHVRALLDVPCGDLHWIRGVSVPPYCSYTGADIVDDVVQLAKKNAAGSVLERSARSMTFSVLDLCTDSIGRYDIVLVRDCFGHLPDADVVTALQNIRDSKSSYLLATHFPTRGEQPDIEVGSWRPIDLCAAPFYMPAPERTLIENCIENDAMFNDKSLALFKLR